MLITRCARRYEVNIEEKTYLPYSLVVIESKSRYFATKENVNCRLPVGCKRLFNYNELCEKLEDENAIVYIDSYIMNYDLQPFLTLKGAKSKTYIVNYDEDGVKLIKVLD